MAVAAWANPAAAAQMAGGAGGDEARMARERWIAWLRRLTLAAAILSAIGWLSDSVVTPLLCKVYG